MSDFTVNMNEYLPLRDLVFNTLRQAILKGELKPGERLMEIQLAEKLGVSRTPIREAIRKLELEGLVLMIPRKGAEVAKISHKSLQDVLEVRGALEELATDLACQRITDEELESLRKAEAHFKQVVSSGGNEMQIAEADEAYHDIIYNASGNKKLVQMINNLREQMYRYRLEYIKDEAKRGTLISEHEKILEAIRLRDIIRAKALMKEHIDNQEMTVSRNLEEGEDEDESAKSKAGTHTQKKA
ncbi:GntR family transcriptional regulator [Oribacterium sp. HCP28S3_H8]|uniref:GntR family transcriptional regulator n=1 Tax=Oribacterium sp. HCP28S3_H8 TaxID=3438945 RepID=UPI003F89F39C